MKINEIIKQRRIERNFTQEQLANYLGVTTPAVNKWEKGVSYPDITLLPALARLLETDLNTLLSFQDDLSDQEIALFLNSLSEISDDKEVEEIVSIVKDKIQQFPTCYSLILNSALFLDGLLAVKEKAEYPETISQYVESLYLRALESPNSTIINQAKAMLISKYMAKKDYQQAQELLSSLPDQDYFDKKQIQINLLIALDNLDEAAKVAEEKLLHATNDIQFILMTLMEIAIKENQMDDAQYIADISQNGAKLFDLWSYHSYVAHFQLYSATKQRTKILKVLIPMLKSLTQKWNINQSPLYRHIKTKEIDKTFGYKMQKAMINYIYNNEETVYLKDNEEINTLLEKLNSDI